MTNKLRYLTLLPASSLMVLASACGASSSSTPAASSTTQQSGSVGVQEASSALARYSALPIFKAPGGKLNGAAIGNGKTILVMATSNTIPYDTAFISAVQTAAQAVGMKVITYNTSGSPSQWAQGIELGISQHVAAIDLVAGLNVDQVIPQIQQAEKAGIAVIASTYNGVGQPAPSYLSADVPLNYELAGQLDADYAIAESKGNADVVVVNSSTTHASLAMTPAVLAQFKEFCPKCKVTVDNIPSTNWSTELQPQLEANLAADPKVDFILPNYDGATGYVVPALLAKGRTKTVKVASFNGTPPSMALLQSGQISMDVGEDISWAGYGTIDATLRVLGKVSPDNGLINENIPLRVFTQSNASDVGVPPTLTQGYGNAAAGYKALWGL